MSGPGWTIESLTVLSLFRQGDKLYGYGVHKQTQLAIGTVFGILKRFEGEGLLASTMESVDPRLSSRVPRNFYKITDAGRDTLRTIRELCST